MNKNNMNNIFQSRTWIHPSATPGYNKQETEYISSN